MKRLLLPLFLLICVFTACKKDSSVVTAEEQAKIDDAKIQAYIKTNNINATKDPSGVYYQVITEGSGTNPTSASTVKVTYTGKLLDGTTFDSASGTLLALSSTIKGWQIGIPYAKDGGRILLIIPSALAYGTSGSGSTIPANSVLVFTIDLLGHYN